MKGGVGRGWRRLHNEELRTSYASPHISTVIKYRTMRWTGYVARKGDEKRIQYFGRKA